MKVLVAVISCCSLVLNTWSGPVIEDFNDGSNALDWVVNTKPAGSSSNLDNSSSVLEGQRDIKISGTSFLTTEKIIITGEAFAQPGSSTHFGFRVSRLSQQVILKVLIRETDGGLITFQSCCDDEFQVFVMINSGSGYQDVELNLSSGWSDVNSSGNGILDLNNGNLAEIEIQVLNNIGASMGAYEWHIDFFKFTEGAGLPVKFSHFSLE